ncbi:esterase [Paractinoplanes abujensis]|uniref:Secreted trypsin-like serine protease n=1 Tax=Paractinoplanes abujensis TaxID=882441 RepID=A0A7W7CQ00_9ACTN|nr:trypsin-like serine protease [Actinoplanes abujensis]MBB4692609.1 secreted trypsin-like serine protease [Actinoplanes abujensis]GID22891.1 esterase [Actinoplanes abujensis]
MSKLLRVCLAIVVVVIGTPRPAHAIANGENAREGAYPFAVLLTMTGLPADGGGTRDSSCSGALIAPRWIITAGHCFRDASGQRVSRTVAGRTTAIMGRTQVEGRGGHEIEVTGVKQSQTTDVALARLATEVTDIEPLRVGTVPPDVGTTLRLTGFGLTARDGSYVPATRLQTGRFVIDAVGDSLLETSGRAPHRDTSPCPHDSGGPYFTESRDAGPVLVAVVSNGPGCPHTGPDLSARTDNISDWITATVTGSTGLPTRYVVAGAAGLLALLTLVLIMGLRHRATAGRRELDLAR